MKVSTLAVVAAAVAGVTAVPEEPGTLAHLQARARDVIGGFFQHHRREQVDTPAVAKVKRSPVRFHNGLGHENVAAQRRDDTGADGEPSSHLNPAGGPNQVDGPPPQDPKASDPPQTRVKRSPQAGATPPPIPINDRKRSPVRFHNGLGHENAAAERRDSGNTNPGGSPPEEEDPEASDPPRTLVLRVRDQKRSPQTGATPPPIPINDRKRSPAESKKSPAQTPVPPLSPFRRALRA
ncbi:hypothetical protein LZ32DRAFT_669942 [Colletotrichum eremochloae]|nr:hypothetical protein LZ32DRAFT_669942 [Colletotrichum eremochloae]